VNKTDRILCIDFGLKFFGLAVADYPGITARGLETLRSDRVEIFSALAQIVRRENITRILLGFPYSDTEGDIHRKIHSFRDELCTHFPAVPVDYVDESYSSAEADALAEETGLGRGRKKRSQDSQAAKLVLLRFLADN
jgi:putative holliday junction resolvase